MAAFQIGQLVWGKNPFRKNVFWPALVEDPEGNVPEAIRRTAVDGRVCLMFLGPSYRPNLNRDWYCREVKDILPWQEHYADMMDQAPGRKDEAVFQIAVSEAQTAREGRLNRPREEGSSRTQGPSPSAPPSTRLPVLLSDIPLSGCEVCRQPCHDPDEAVYCARCERLVHIICDPMAIIPSKTYQWKRSCVYYCPSCRPVLDDLQRDRFRNDFRRELQLMQCRTTKPDEKDLFQRIVCEFHRTISIRTQTSGIKEEHGSQSKSINPSLPLLRRPLDHPRIPFPDPKPDQIDKPVPAVKLKLLPTSLLSSSQTSRSTANRSLNDLQIQREIPVECNGIPGTFYLGEQKVRCECEECAAKPSPDRVFTATHFEQHCGAGSAKKWKASVRIRPGGVPEVSSTDPPLPLGRWFVMKGIDELVTRVPVSSRKRDSSRSAKRHLDLAESGFDALERAQPSGERPWNQVKVGGYRKIHVRYAGDRCNVCDADVDYDCDQLISCDGCGITVHQTCYGVHEKVSSDTVWLCNVCRAQGTENAECCLCPVVEGARKPTTIPGLWCHVACMQWIPEVTVENPMKMEPISRVDKIQKERWELNCCFCKRKMGAKIQCTACYTSYHPLCARIAGAHMEMKDGPQGQSGPLDLITYCPRHAPLHPELSGVKIVSDEEEGSCRKLSNRQPYEQAMGISVPLPPSGCARSEPLRNWVRKSHGSGSGYGTVEAFWIPLKPAKDDLGNLVNPDGSLFDPKVVPKFRLKRPKSRAGTIRAQKSRRLNETDIISPVRLVPLPEGVKEEVTVECNEVRAKFLVRSQKVRFNGSIIPAAKFEGICGRGDAKKWKSSLWHVDEGTDVADCQMNAWLMSVGLDRKVLAMLRDNYSKFDAYETHVKGQVSKTVEDILNSLIRKEKAVEQPGEGPMVIDQPDNTAEEDMKSIDQMSCSDQGEMADRPSEISDLISTHTDQKDTTVEEILPANQRFNNSDAGDQGRDLVGRAVVVCRGSEKEDGLISGYREQQDEHCVRFSNGNVEWMKLSDSDFNLDEPSIKTQKQSEDDHMETESTTALPDQIDVVCNTISASFLVKERIILSEQGLRMTPREFERACGKGAAKKWKNSIKVKGTEGNPVMALGEWLIRSGLDAPTISAQTRSTSRFSSFSRTRLHRGDPGWLSQKQRRQRHPIGCQCAVCSQSQRRTSLTGRIDTDRAEKWQPATTLAALRARGPGLRHGKKAYIEALPQIVGGISRHQLHEVPPSRSWDVQEWIQHVKGLNKDSADKVQCKSEKWRAQLKVCNETQEERVTFGKSGIHGWGLFALRKHKQDEMIIEYKGEIVTPAVADMREARYRSMEKDCYLFHVTDSFIIDATVKGSIARFINHCCEPCMYCKDIQIDGKNHLCFFARYDIQAGQELTYDYRFKEEVEENKLVCDCGAPNCRGFLN